MILHQIHHLTATVINDGQTLNYYITALPMTITTTATTKMVIGEKMYIYTRSNIFNDNKDTYVNSKNTISNNTFTTTLLKNNVVMNGYPTEGYMFESNSQADEDGVSADRQNHSSREVDRNTEISYK